MKKYKPVHSRLRTESLIATQALALALVTLALSGLTGCEPPGLKSNTPVSTSNQTVSSATPRPSSSPAASSSPTPSTTPTPTPTPAPGETVPFAISQETLNYNTRSDRDGVTRASSLVLTYPTHLLTNGERRPVIIIAPGWGGTGNVGASQSALAQTFAQHGYLAVNVGFHQTGATSGGALTAWYADLPESTKVGLDQVCAKSFAQCAYILLSGTSYGGIQTHIVMRYVRSSGYASVGNKNALAMLAQDAGYALTWDNLGAQTSSYSVAMIENQGDTSFPIDTCDYNNCGARNRGDAHLGDANVLSKCPAGGNHGSRGYASWDAWVLSAAKVMLHSQRGAPTFSGYVAPSIATSNECHN